MRKSIADPSKDYRIAVLDDEQGIIDSLSVVVGRMGYEYHGFTHPLEAVERIRAEKFDMLILDYLMDTVHGDEVIRRIRKFDPDLYILLLTGHKDLAPPLDTIKSLDIQGYCEKSDRFDQMILLIESGIKSISRMKQVQRYKDGLNALVHIAPDIYRLKPAGRIMSDILDHMRRLFNCQNAYMIAEDLSHPEKRSLFRGIGSYGVDTLNPIAMQATDVMAICGRARLEKRAVRSGTVLVLPLMDEMGEPYGSLYVEGITDDHGVALIEILAKQGSSAIRNAFLHNLVNEKNDELRRTYESLQTMYMESVEALRRAVDAKDVYTRGHSDRVAAYAVQIGEAMGLPQQDCELLRLGGLFHDIGKIGTADDILFKTQELSHSEYEEIKLHPSKGADILAAVSMFDGVVPIILNHHERIDGCGYPNGIPGSEIPLLSRIVSVADAFDAMTTTRLYRKEISNEEAFDQLSEASGTQFDAEIVRVFLGCMKSAETVTEEVL